MQAPGWKWPRPGLPATGTGRLCFTQLRQKPSGTLLATLQAATQARQSMHREESMIIAY